MRYALYVGWASGSCAAGEGTRGSRYPQKARLPPGLTDPGVADKRTLWTILMIENYRTGLIWNLMRRCPPVVASLRRAGFTGGWL